MKTIADIKDEEWKVYLAVFKVFLMHYKELWIVNNDSFKKAIFLKYHSDPATILETHKVNNKNKKDKY